ncbi:MAG: hypothetical protein J2P25_12170 [Nocardiopsaceae bacterium]|nr:hypothetical protein [Nocardiopsaceae bacterium]
MIARAVVCPSPPLLAEDLTGRATVLPDLAGACADAVARLLASGPEVVTVVGGGPATQPWDPGARLDLAAYGPGASGAPGSRAPGLRAPGLPLALGIGAKLLDDAGYAGPRQLQAVDEHATPDDCLNLGVALADDPFRTGLLVVGDGSARRDPKAPGHLDERAAPFDAAVEQALRDGDMLALADLDPRLARELMATGRAAWQVLAGAFESPPPADILYADAPFGVFYLVAVLDPLAAGWP